MKRLFYLFVAGALALASCGGDDDDPVTTDNNGGSNSGSSDNNGSSATKSTDWTMPLYTVSQDGDTTVKYTYDENYTISSYWYQYYRGGDTYTATLTYDSKGRLLQSVCSDNTGYSYTIDGLTRTSTTKNSSELCGFYVYDGNGGNEHVVEYSKSVETFTDETFKKYASVVAYDEDGNVNVTIDYTYDSNGLLSKKVLNYKGEPYKVWEYEYGDKEMSYTETKYWTTYTMASWAIEDGYKSGELDYTSYQYYTYKDDKYEYMTSHGGVKDDGTREEPSQVWEYDDQNRITKVYYGASHYVYSSEYFEDYKVTTYYKWDDDAQDYTDEVVSTSTTYYMVH